MTEVSRGRGTASQALIQAFERMLDMKPFISRVLRAKRNQTFFLDQEGEGDVVKAHVTNL